MQKDLRHFSIFIAPNKKVNIVTMKRSLVCLFLSFMLLSSSLPMKVCGCFIC